MRGEKYISVLKINAQSKVVKYNLCRFKILRCVTNFDVKMRVDVQIFVCAHHFHQIWYVPISGNCNRSSVLKTPYNMLLVH